MTTIVAVQGNGWVVMGADSRTVDGSKIYTLTEESGKLIENGKFLMAVAGDLRAVALLRHRFSPTPASPSLHGIALDNFISTKFLPELKEFMEAELPSDDDDDENSGSGVLVAVNGVAYEIDENYAWVRSEENTYAVGTGGSVASGILLIEPIDSLITVESAEARVRKAIEIAVKLDNKSGLPVRIKIQKAQVKVKK